MTQYADGSRTHPLAQSEIEGIDFGNVVPIKSLTPEKPPAPSEPDWRMFAIKEIDGSSSLADPAQPNGQSLNYDADDTRREIDAVCESARRTIAAPLRALVNTAGLALNFSAGALALGTAQLVAPSALDQLSLGWTQLAFVPAAIAGGLILSLCFRSPLKCQEAKAALHSKYSALKIQLGGAAAEFRTLDILRSTTALFKQARLWHAMLAMADRLPIEALQSKLSWDRHIRRAGWILILSLFALVWLPDFDASRILSGSALKSPALAAAIALIAVSLATGAWLVRKTEKILSGSDLHDESDPVTTTASWYQDVLMQLNRLQAAFRGRGSI